MPLDQKTAYNDDSDLMKIDPIPFSDKPRSKKITFNILIFSHNCPKNNSKRNYSQRKT
jgi:hypothetical protein